LSDISPPDIASQDTANNADWELEHKDASFRNGQGRIDSDFLTLVTEAVEAEESTRLSVLVEDLHGVDLADLLEALEPEIRPRLIELLGADFDFTALTEVDDGVREDIIDELKPETLAEGVRELDSDDAVYILEDMNEAGKAAVLKYLSAPERVVLQRSLDAPEGSAGRRMQTEFIAVPPFWTVGQTIDYLRETQDLPDTFHDILIVDPAFHLVGTVSLDRLLRTKRPVPVSEILQEDPQRILVTDELLDTVRLFERYNLISAPVVDDAGRLVGVITIDDIVDIIEDEADSDIKALGGVKYDEELSDDVFDIAKSRFTWLLVNLLTAILASLVISYFQHSLEKMVALAVLMPIVASMGGNAGTQTMTVAVRALATRELGPSNVWRIVRREVIVGLINGLAFALLLAAVAVIWFGVAQLAPVIGLALVITLVCAASSGIIIPLLLERFHIDPAVASGPLVTTVTDVVGFFAFLGIASWWFGLG
jgi:magnesium transporter